MKITKEIYSMLCNISEECDNRNNCKNCPFNTFGEEKKPIYCVLLKPYSWVIDVDMYSEGDL